MSKQGKSFFISNLMLITVLLIIFATISNAATSTQKTMALKHLNLITLSNINFSDNQTYWSSLGFTVYNLTSEYNSVVKNSTSANSIYSSLFATNDLQTLYSGYSTFDRNSFSYAMTGAFTTWKVVQTPQTKGTNYLSQWVGIGGDEFSPFSDKTLIQIGTESNSDYTFFGGTPPYYAWFEFLGSSLQETGSQIVITKPVFSNSINLSTNHIFAAPVAPDDLIYAEVNFVKNISGKQQWHIFLADENQSWVAYGIFNFSSNETTADFITEDVSPCSTNSCNSYPFSKFNISLFGEDFTGTLNGTTSESAVGGNISILTKSSGMIIYTLRNNNSTILATPDPITPDGTSFGITYGNMSIHAAANKTIAHFGDKVSINATVSGGTGPFAYQWYTANQSFGLTPLHFKSATTNTLRATVTGNTIYVVYVTDTGAPQPYPVAYDYVIVNISAANSTSPNNLYPPAISPISPKIDTGQSILLHATENIIPKGGSLLWQWYTVKNNTPTAIPNATYTSLNVNGILSNATYEVSVASTVGSGNAVFSAPDNVIVFPHFITPTITPSNPTITKGQSVTLTASESGGTGIFSYQWYTVANSMITPISNATAMTLSVSPNSTTSYEVQVTDTGTNANATPTESALSLPDTVTVISGVTMPYNVTFYVPVVITNNAPVSPKNYDLAIPFNYANYTQFENSTVPYQNIEWFNSNGTVIPSWIEAPQVTWLYIGNSLDANSNLTVYAGFGSPTTNFLNSSGKTGLAPNFASNTVYAQYDNGNVVFPFYDDFAGTHLNTNIWQCPDPANNINCEWEGAVDNGIYLYNSSECTYLGQGYTACAPSSPATKAGLFTSPFDLTINFSMGGYPPFVRGCSSFSYSFGSTYTYNMSNQNAYCAGDNYIHNDILIEPGFNSIKGNFTLGSTTLYDNSGNGRIDEAQQIGYFYSIVRNYYEPYGDTYLNNSHLILHGMPALCYGYLVCPISGFDHYAGGTPDIVNYLFEHTPDPIEGSPPFITVGAPTAPQSTCTIPIKPAAITSFACIKIHNGEAELIQSGFQQQIILDSANYSALEAPSLNNTEFFYANGTIIPSWLESGTGVYSSASANRLSVSSATRYFVRLSSAIAPNGTIAIYYGFAAKNTNLFNEYNNGLAPQLSQSYGYYDDGSSVFNFYDNFAGSALSGKWNNVVNIAYSVDNGITMTGVYPSQHGFIIGTGLRVNPGEYDADFYGDLHQTNTNWVGIGFGKPFNTNEFNNTGIFSGYSGSYENGVENAYGGACSLTAQMNSAGGNFTWTVEPTSATITNYYLDYADRQTASCGFGLPYPLYPALIIANAGGTTYTFSRPVTIYWYLSRRQPPNGIMPSVSISNVTA